MNTTNNIVPAQVIALKKQQVILKTETNEVITVAAPKGKNKHKIFMLTMTDLLRSGLWIPVNRVLHQLMRYDWFDTQIINYSF
ncbi:hypothetical protein JCM15457_1980 [Liquorilactobacillus sucicola DSM 21376 = JCM 15457]|uniref:Uncharacterized protein n=1 Tax=Liquorilactobacillus sucicola DSM 21376 = JCM 15457 TaxID=1423806 RepID=A0A023CYN6_9LACO|nr:hypothetical protein [Liquorilactobacillus sucicola]KRN06750.1 hypothetical protein FD15_GL000305 [Liquorilactobacillus sucicola DSM 21376 = JCM 15457]GAJ27023.1 hypothetical protein JCM15457_1980 [Liquorilactobacillus sucicola DSM 21376 = JCM 15457]